MKDKQKLIFTIFVLLIIFLLGLKYRLRGYDYFPPIGNTYDEQLIVWLGSSLINNGVPAAWSFIPDYKKYQGTLEGWAITVDGQKPNISNFSNLPKPIFHNLHLTLDGLTTTFTMVQPFIEQPPLGGMLASFLSGSYKKETFADVTLSQIRLPVVILSSLSILLVFTTSYLTYGTAVGLLSSLIFALTPTFIVSQRIATSENYLTFFYLIGIIFLQLWIKFGKRVFIILTSILVTICYLIKPFGVSLSIIIFLSILIFKKPKKYLILPILFAILGILIFYAYGSFYDAELFQKIVFYQGNRLTSPLQSIAKILVPRIQVIFLDGWIIFGFISLGALFLKDMLKRDFWVLGPIFIQLFIYLIYGGNDYGWYRLSLYPFLSISSAYLLYLGIKKSQPWVGLLFLLTVFSTSIYWGTFGLDWRSHAFTFRITALFIAGGICLSFLKNIKLKFLSSSILILLILFSFWMGVKAVNSMNVIWHTLVEHTPMIP